MCLGFGNLRGLNCFGLCISVNHNLTYGQIMSSIRTGTSVGKFYFQNSLVHDSFFTMLLFILHSEADIERGHQPPILA